jgi:hypothetical protein
MFKMLGNLTKAVVSVAVAPVAVIVDVVKLPETATDPRRGPFDTTGSVLKNAGECFKKAVEPD